MDLLRLLSTEAPSPRPFRDDKPTLLISWWGTCYAITIILFRIGGRYVRAEKLFRDDTIMLAAIVPLLIRMAFVHVILLYGTNNTLIANLSPGEISRREIGSRLVLASRIMYAAYLWAIKYSTSTFLRTLTAQVWQRSHSRVLQYLHGLMGITFLAVVIADLAECQPFSHYWQVTPDPGPQCRQAPAQFLTLAIANMITNLALVVFPLPMILKSRLPTRGKFNIIVLLALPMINVAYTIFTLPTIPNHNYAQHTRSLLASVDVLLAAFVSNAIVLTSLVRDKGYKKTKYKPSNVTTAVADSKFSRGRIVREERWGSDEDLMRSSDGGSKEVLEDGIEMGKMARATAEEVREPPKAKMMGIRVAQTFDVEVEELSADGSTDGVRRRRD